MPEQIEPLCVEIGTKVSRVYTAVEPDSAFVRRLEQALTEKGEKRISAPQRLSIHRSWVFGFAIFLAAILSILALGPQRVIAQVQLWLGYLPGYGFTDLEEVRVLTLPVEKVQEGTTMTVSETIAGLERTVVTVESNGLNIGDFFLSDEVLEIFLRLPDRQTLGMEEGKFWSDEAELVFPALPNDVYQVDLIINDLPMSKPSALQQDWVLPLELRPFARERVESLQKPYQPAGTRETYHEIQFEVLQVAQSVDETAVQVQLRWDDPIGQIWSGNLASQMVLQDNLGRNYLPRPDRNGDAEVVIQKAEEVDDRMPTGSQLIQQTIFFEPISSAAEQVSLILNEITIQQNVSGNFVFDPGENAQVDQSWVLGTEVEISGFSLHIDRADLIVDNKSNTHHNTPYRLDFYGHGVISGERTLFGLDMDRQPNNASGYLLETHQSGTFLYSLWLKDLPEEAIQFNVKQITYLLSGPWEVTWDLPRTAETDGL